MGRGSIKAKKSMYQIAREKRGLTREQASERTHISTSKIERIESGKIQKIDPHDVFDMARAYNEPVLCNHYCTKECPIGRKYGSRVDIETIKDITIEILASLDNLEKEKELLVRIVRDGSIENKELGDFTFIQSELERMSSAIEALQIWVEKASTEGRISKEQYNNLMKTKK